MSHIITRQSGSHGSLSFSFPSRMELFGSILWGSRDLNDAPTPTAISWRVPLKLVDQVRFRALTQGEPGPFPLYLYSSPDAITNTTQIFPRPHIVCTCDDASTRDLGALWAERLSLSNFFFPRLHKLVLEVRSCGSIPVRSSPGIDVADACLPRLPQ